MTTSAGSLTTGERYHQGNLHVPDVIHVPYPYGYRCALGGATQRESEERCADYLDYVLNTPYTAADDVAAVILEPIQGEGGYIAPSAYFLERVKAICEKNGCLYVSDEVQAGAGRSGTMWVVEQSSVEPDVLTWGKGMGGDAPMAGATFRKDLALQIPESIHPNTFAGNGVGAVVTMTNIDVLTENNAAIPARAATLGEETMRPPARRGTAHPHHRRRSRPGPDDRHRARRRQGHQGAAGRRAGRPARRAQCCRRASSSCRAAGTGRCCGSCPH